MTGARPHAPMQRQASRENSPSLVMPPGAMFSFFSTALSTSLDEDQDGWLTIAIADDGRGMEPEFLARVTDPFTTTRTTRRGRCSASSPPR